ncbi:MAG: zinc ribbon domain-containing protein [Deltaproteobacteria bacterium]|nr:zinc ribbon domain-containing protein [Deltaproteobacteria bacterium]
MLTYVYECARCGTFEQRQPISDPALGRCPTCGGEVRRLIAGGTGFLVKDRGSRGSHCDRATPCCGRETRCDRPPCGK